MAVVGNETNPVYLAGHLGLNLEGVKGIKNEFRLYPLPCLFFPPSKTKKKKKKILLSL